MENKTKQNMKKKYKILLRYVDKQENNKTIYYIVKRKKINDKKGLTMDEILKLDPFEDEVIKR